MTTSSFLPNYIMDSHLTTQLSYASLMYLYPCKSLKPSYTAVLKKIDTNTSKQDLSDVISPNSSVSDYNNHLRSVLDKHTPLCRRTSRTRKPTPWFSSIAEQFCRLKGSVGRQRDVGLSLNSPSTNKLRLH